MRALRFHFMLASLVLTAAELSAGPMTLELKKKFVEEIKNRAAIQTSLHVDRHLKVPHPIGKSGDDGDIHMAGRDSKVALPLVAEIMNAKGQAAVKVLNQAAAAVPIEVSGVWRIWFEHPASDGSQVQGEPVPVPANSNPDHVFEIHPLLTFGDQRLGPTLVPIADPGPPPKAYETAEAKRAFAAYEKLTATIGSTPTAISITSGRAGFNYVKFVIEPVGQAEIHDDALFLLARVFAETDLEEPLTESPIRMVFVKGSPPAQELANHPGETLTVLGSPRVDLAKVAEIAQAQDGDGQEDTVSLPYEMVIVGVFPSGG